jgi:hypothetical protein
MPLLQYRLKVAKVLRDACTDLEDSDKLATKLLGLAERLEHCKGIATPTEREMIDEREESCLQNAWNKLLPHGTSYGGRLLPLQARPSQQRPVLSGFLHSLPIILLAFCMVGSINAANTAYTHQ